MAHDGQTLLLYMTEEKGSFNNDIYVCFLQPGDWWSEPKSLGKKINLPKYNEMTPYLAADGETLYFSSDRPGGLGDNDIWMTKRLIKPGKNGAILLTWVALSIQKTGMLFLHLMPVANMPI